MDSVVAIFDEKSNFLGTGFSISNDASGSYIATCKHVSNNPTVHQLLVNDRPAHTVALNISILDLDVLYVEGVQIEPLTLSSDTSKGPVIVNGYSKFDKTIKFEPIEVAKIKNDVAILDPLTALPIEMLKLYPTEDISYGYSGSPIICSNTGFVIGVMQKQSSASNYAVHTSHIRDIVKVGKYSSLKSSDSNNQPDKNSPIKEWLLDANQEQIYTIGAKLTQEFHKSLQTFSGTPAVWAEPNIYNIPEDDLSKKKEKCKVEMAEIISSPYSYVIQAPPQFGLTCLAKHLQKRAWYGNEQSLWIYLDATTIRPYRNHIENTLKKICKDWGINKNIIECVIIDRVSENIKDVDKLLQTVSDYFADKKIITCLSIDYHLSNSDIRKPSGRKFEECYLWALDRSGLRGIVNQYNSEKYIGDEDKMLQKAVMDLQALNIPRTPFNCVTVLKLYEHFLDETPINRTQMIHRLLFLMFNDEAIPTYKSRPDTTDVENTLGSFCANLLIKNINSFTRETFNTALRSHCDSQEIHLEVELIFDVFISNNILIEYGLGYCFKFSYWTFYFSAHHMHHNKEFASFIFDNQQHIFYPELIEFYTGIDRRRDNAIKKLTDDLKSNREKMAKELGFPDDFNIYDYASWAPSDKLIQRMQEDVKEDVLSSNLPKSLKDEYADTNYDRTKPLNQKVESILEEFSYRRLINLIRSACVGLRNSDYVNPKLKHSLLTEILLSWEESLRVVIALAPILAKDGEAKFGGTRFILDDEYYKLQPKERFHHIVDMLPGYQAQRFENDIFSRKMGPLLFKHESESPLGKHMLNILLVRNRPEGWDEYLLNEIERISSDSFYLCDLLEFSALEYQFAITTNSNLSKLKRIMKTCLAKHKYSKSIIGPKLLNKIPDTALPTREVPDE